MFERFTERSREVVAHAQEEARTLKHDHVGPEHILLGLLREREAIAAHVLESFDITLERARGEVVRIVGVGDAVIAGQMPFAPEAKRVLEQSSREALSLGSNHVGTEHLLLAILRLGEGVPTRILLDCDAQPDAVRQTLMRMLAGSGASTRQESATRGGPPASGNGFEEWIRVGPGVGLRRLLMQAAARALDEGREDIQPRDVLLALTRDERTGPLLAELGVDDVAIMRALERRRPPESPPASTGG